ncbi:putative zinc protease [Cucumispora dikerogammari]|nr:putative zinc protease [Cucumispora dikerogammari]
MIEKHPFDRNEYQQFVLPNHLRTTTISRTDLDKASISLLIHAGAFKDPEEYQGLAHFLEHLLFMGSEKYPKENQFTDFLSLHNGSYNAYTCEEKTVFFLEIDQKFLFEACDILAHFFITPLFYKDSVLREVNAVNSEFLNRVNNDSIRRDHIYNITCKKTAPNNRFLCGNLESLNKPKLRDNVIEFWKTNYKQMELVVYGRENSETLKTFIEKTFGLIQNLVVPLNYYEKEKYSDIKTTSIHENPLFIEIEPFADIKSLILSIKLPSAYRLPYNQYDFFSYCLERTASGSLINILKKKGLIHNLDVYISSNSYFTIMEIVFSLTEKGDENVNQVLSFFTEYEFSFYPEFIDHLDFYFKVWETPNATDHCLDLVNMMHIVPFHDMFHYKKTYCFDIDLFNKIRKAIQNYENWTVLHLIKNKTFSNKESLYGIRYNVHNLTSVFDKKVLEPKKYSDVFKAPVFNDKIHRFEQSSVNYRLLVLNSDKYTSSDGMIIFLHCNTDFVSNFFQLKSFIEVFEENCYKTIDRDNTTIEYEIYEHGIQIEILSRDIQNVVEIFENKESSLSRNYKNSPYCEIVKSQIYEKLKLIEKEPPYKKITRVLKTHIFDKKSLSEQFNDLQDMEFSPIIPDKIDLFISGDLSDLKCKELSAKIQQLFQLSEEKKEGVSDASIRVENKQSGSSLNELMNNSTCLESTSNDIKNNAFGMFLRARKSILNELKFDIILSYAAEQFFDKLRTKEQLGYVVYCRKFVIEKHSYMGFVVQSETDCTILHKKVKNFIEDLPATFPVEKLDELKEALKNSLIEEHVNKKEFMQHYFGLWKRDFDPVDFRKEALLLLENIKVADIDFNQLFDTSFCISIKKLNV